ncbi:MAG: YdiU family protein [Nocardioides sp.]|uniref:protein adenylyltransferase SelO n=1 Tax=Nocardioides sp. TaxID=35761 RepID=UPI00239D26E6|nr:YdiU family protein [Nocardioides sp.]MDE0777635.1 YdiU family protein [Nocardioides sp.]
MSDTSPATTDLRGLADLGHAFADAVPELALPWTAAEAPAPRLLALNESVAGDLGLDPAELRTDAGLGLLVGTRVPTRAKPVAQGYAGHQFGGFAPRLGDGRALLVGELHDRGGGLRDLHLKGSGRTPWARGGDGLAAVGPMLREYVVSEALHHLGIPTTRALAVTATGATVRREVPLPGAVLARVASSHLRVGSFQYARALDQASDQQSGAQSGAQSDGSGGDVVRRLADHAISRHYPELVSIGSDPERYLALFRAVVSAQAALVARWMLVGFVHGVMNTDNVTISGETIDYGPCAFLDVFDPTTVFSSIDEGGRYAFGNQPPITEWNLARLAEALLPLLDEQQERAVEIALEALGGFREQYAEAWSSGMRAKLGIAHVDAEVGAALTDDLFGLIRGQADYTSYFRALGRAARGDLAAARDRVLDVAGFDAWATRWSSLQPDAAAMDRVNPVYIARNHLVEEALADATAGDLAAFERLNDALARPFDERAGLERYAEPAPAGFGAYTTYCGT